MRATNDGAVVNEAMSALPVIVSDICGCCEDLVIEGKTGFAFSPDSMDRLGELMLRISEDPKVRNKMAEAALEHVKNYSQKCSLKIFSKHVLRLIRIGISNMKSPIIILGSPRSGTTILGSLLSP